MEDKITKAVVLKRYTPKTDGSVSITFETMEQSPQEVALMHSLRNQCGVLYFRAQDQLTEEEQKDLDSLELEYNGKSKSRRLKDVLYRYWQSLDTDKNNKEFYSDKMEELINHFKSKIDE